MASKKYYVGIDIGGTNIKSILRYGKNVVAESSIKTKEHVKSQKDIINSIDKMIEGYIKRVGRENIKGIGVGSKGRVNSKGLIVKSDSFSVLNNLDLVSIFNKKFSIKTKVVNDGKIPYYLVRDKVKNKNVLVVTLGTGIGTAIFNKGKPYGNGAFSSTFAHAKFKDGEREDYVSIRFLLKKAKEHGLNIKTPKDLSNLAKKSRPAKEVYKEYGENIGEVLSILTNKHDIDIIYFGGGISKGHKLFLPHVKKSLKKYSKKKKIPNIKVINFKHEIGAYGASLMFE